MTDRPGNYNCWREYAMAFRRRNGQLAVAKAIRNGQLLPAKKCRCTDCGKPARCYDHRDYRKPLQVDPVCKKCDSKRGSGKPFFCDERAASYKRLLSKAKKWYLTRHRQRVRQIVNGK